MFRQIRQQNNINKIEGRSKSPRNYSKSAGKTYSSISKHKHNRSQAYNYELLWICDHLYQGQLKNNRKHGEGVMILDNGVMVIGKWNQGYLNGYCLFFTPLGGKIYCPFLKGQLQGIVFVCYEQNIEINTFTNDERNLVRIRFDCSENLWVKSLYKQDGTLQNIITLQKGTKQKLPSFLRKNHQLKELYQSFIIQKNQFFNQQSFQRIKYLEINGFEYYGYLNTEAIPSGLGIIYSATEIYAGNFKCGSLDKYGLILFENGFLYKGQLIEGKIQGNGAMYDPYLDETKYIKNGDDGLENIISEQNGLDISSVPFQIGKIHNQNIDNKTGFQKGIQNICQQIARYYYKEHSEYNSAYSSQYSFHVKQNSKFIDSGLTNPQYKLYDSYHSKAEETVNEDSLDEIVQQISNPKSILGLPLKNTPTFEKLALGKQKKQYPHLKQFEMTKAIKFYQKTFEKPGMIYERPLKNNGNI